MANNTPLKDASGNTFYVESYDNGSGIMRPATAANLKVANNDVSNSNPVAISSTDGALVTLGNTSDSAYDGSNNRTINGILKGIYNKFASLVTTSLGSAYRVVLVDPSTGNGSLVQAFHNTDNQIISGTSYGLMTGGVDQLVNGSGNLDRKRGVAGDTMAVTGLAAEVPMVFNGTTYDRLYGDKTNGLWANIKVLPGLPTGANTIGAVTQSGTWNIGTITTIPGLPTGANTIGAVTQSGTWNIGTITTIPGLPTGANTIGATTSIINSPTQSSVTPGTSAYATGYALGASGTNAVRTFTVPTNGVAQNFGVSLSSGTYTGSIDLIIFKSAPGTYNDGAAVTLSAADAAKILQVIHCTDLTSLGGAMTFVQALGQAIAYNTGTTSLYILPVLRGAVTFTASSTVTLAFEIVQ